MKQNSHYEDHLSVNGHFWGDDGCLWSYRCILFINILWLHTYTDLFRIKGSLKASTGFIPSFCWTTREHQCLLFFFLSCHRTEVYRHGTSLRLLAQLHWLQGPTHGRGSWPHVCGQQRLHPLPGPKWHQQRASYSKQEHTFITSLTLSLGAVMLFQSTTTKQKTQVCSTTGCLLYNSITILKYNQ